GVAEAQLTEPALADQLARSLLGFSQERARGRAQPHARLSSQADEAPRSVVRQGERLLAEDVLARAKRRAGDRFVCVVRRQHDNDVDAVFVENLVERLVAPTAVALDEAAGAIRDRVSGAGELDRRPSVGAY